MGSVLPYSQFTFCDAKKKEEEKREKIFLSILNHSIYANVRYKMHENGIESKKLWKIY